MNLSLHYATVVDNVDTDKKAKIKIRILPEMVDFDETKLPWVRPFINDGMTSTQYSYNAPANNSKIWVVFTDKAFKTGYYLTGTFIDGFFDYSKIKTSLDSITELSDSTYANTRFSRFSDGTIIFHNDDTGEMGVYHSSGKYIVIDNNGEVNISGNANITGDVTMTSLAVGTATSPVTLYANLKTAIDSLLVILAAHVHADPISGSTGPPLAPLVSTTSTSIGLPAAESQDTTTS